MSVRHAEAREGELPSSIWSSDPLGSARRGLTRSWSPTLSDFCSGDSSTTPKDDTVAVKVVHSKSNIILRINRNISFTEMRARVYDKFVQQEGLPLSASFALAFLPPPPIDGKLNKPQSQNMPIVSPIGSLGLEHKRFISSQSDWEHVIESTGGGKLILQAVGDQGV
jgi:hypothetical protein